MTKTTKKPSDTFGGIGSDAVLAATGKSWKQWLSLLDKEGAKKLTHREIVAVVHDRYGIGPWWRQMVTVGYEQARGLRKKHQKPGGFSIGRSKTVAVPVSKLFDAWHNAKKRSAWLDGGPLAVRKATPNKSMRITWGDGETALTVNFYPKGASKAQVTVEHGKLSSAKQAEKMKTYWAKNLTRLQTMLES